MSVFVWGTSTTSGRGVCGETVEGDRRRRQLRSQCSGAERPLPRPSWTLRVPAARRSSTTLPDSSACSRTSSASALKKALENQLQADVTAGRLTQAQADAQKKRIESGDYPLLGTGGGFGPGMGWVLAASASATAASGSGRACSPTSRRRPRTSASRRPQLRTDLMGGKTLADVATAQGKTADGLVSTLVAAVAEATRRGCDGGKADVDAGAGDREEPAADDHRSRERQAADGDGAGHVRRARTSDGFGITASAVTASGSRARLRLRARRRIRPDQPGRRGRDDGGEAIASPPSSPPFLLRCGRRTPSRLRLRHRYHLWRP